MGYRAKRAWKKFVGYKAERAWEKFVAKRAKRACGLKIFFFDVTKHCNFVNIIRVN